MKQYFLLSDKNKAEIYKICKQKCVIFQAVLVFIIIFLMIVSYNGVLQLVYFSNLASTYFHFLSKKLIKSFNLPQTQSLRVIHSVLEFFSFSDLKIFFKYLKYQSSIEIADAIKPVIRISAFKFNRLSWYKTN